MGGSYTAGETGCVGGCERVFKHGDKVIVVNQATYNEREEVLDFEPYTEDLYCEECWKSLGTKVHQAIIALDSELAVASDGEYREQLTKAAYALRNIEVRKEIERRESDGRG